MGMMPAPAPAGQRSRSSLLLWGSLAVPLFLLLATCVLIAGEMRVGDAAAERALRAQDSMKSLGQLRQVLQIAAAAQPEDRAGAVAQARRMLADMQKTWLDRQIYPAEFDRLQDLATMSLDELDRQGTAPVASAVEHQLAPGFGSAHHATFNVIESLEAKERFASELDDQMAKHYKNDLEVELGAAAFLVIVLQAWIWVILRVEYRQRARVEQLLRETNQQLELNVQDRTASLTAANRRLIQVQEQERRNLARELHDQLGQQMATLLLNLRRLQSKSTAAEPTAATPLLLDSVEIAQGTYDQIRNLALELRPALLDRMGLVAAVEWYGRQQEARSGCEITVTADAHSDRVAAEVATAAFRIVQEAVTNAIRHGESTSISIFFQCQDGWLDLGIHDDGKGFDVDEAADLSRDGFGLPGMEERARLVRGAFSVRSSAQSGTEINVRLPMLPRVSEESDTAESG
jgi:signal transduction histidine kinase